MHGSARPTRLSLRDMRAQAVHGLLASPRGAGALVVADIPRLPDLRSWDRLALDVAIADLLADGRLADDEVGRLAVRPVEPSEQTGGWRTA